MRTTKEIAKTIREDLKKEFPNCKFSAVVDYPSIRIALMSSNESPYIDGALTGNSQINHYYINNDNRLTASAKQLFSKVVEIATKEHYDNSRIEIDYFDTNYYLSLNIGKWDNPFVVTETKQVVKAQPIVKKSTMEMSASELLAFVDNLKK